MKLLVIFSVAASLIAAGCSTSPGAAASVSKPDEPDLRRVTTANVEERPFDELVVVTGTLAAEQQITLGLKVAGRIAELPVDLGTTVLMGDVVARLDTTDFALRVRQSEAALQQARVRLGLPPVGGSEEVDIEQTAPVRAARAQMDSARARLDRALQLVGNGLMAMAELDAVNGAFKVAEAEYADSLDEARNRQGVLAQRRSELEIARQQLADAVLYAPITGAVLQRNANIGEFLAAGTPVAMLVQMNPLRLKTEVPEREAVRIRAGMAVRVSVEGAAGIHQGRVVRLSPAIDEASRTLLVETEVSNAGNTLRPGAFARAEIVVASRQGALFVPASAIATFAGIDRVFVVHDGVVSEERIRTGRRTDGGAEILEGVKAGDAVVIDPGNLTDGEKVVVAKE